MRFSAGSVCRLSGLKFGQLDRYVRFGLVKPDSQGTYSLSQVLALATASRYRDEGATWERIEGVIQFLARLPVEKLECELAAGRSWPVPATMLGITWAPGLLIEPSKAPRGAAKLMRALDMQVIYRDVMREVKRLQRLPHNRPIKKPRKRASV